MNPQVHDQAGPAGQPAARTWLAGVAVALLLAGCAPGGDPMTDPAATPRPSLQTATPTASPSPGPETQVPPKRWAAILADLAGRGVPTDSVSLVSSRSVTWNDGSLGCPVPGQSYTQALVPGLQVLVRVDGTQYDYRFGRSDTPKLCER